MVRSNIATCSSCGAKVFWASTLNDKKMPLDYPAVEHGNMGLGDGLTFIAGRRYRGPKYTSHFDTCPQRKT